MHSGGTAPGKGAVFLSPDERDLCLVVRYDGTDYHGFQKQKNALTIQGVLEAVLQRLLGSGQIVGASRTDTGVHAQGQVAVWRGPVGLPLDRLVAVVNRRLPAGIGIVGARWVVQGWDPRRAAHAKQYSYRIWRGDDPPALPWHRLVYPYFGPLSWRSLQESSEVFVGEHDFRAFRTEGAGVKTTVRTIYQSRWLMEEGGRIWRYQVVGNGFLYRMVRHMVGSMLKAAEPNGSIEAIKAGLANPAVKAASLAPAQGLMLDWIEF